MSWNKEMEGVATTSLAGRRGKVPLKGEGETNEEGDSMQTEQQVQLTLPYCRLGIVSSSLSQIPGPLKPDPTNPNPPICQAANVALSQASMCL